MTLEAEWLRGVVNSPEYKNATYRVVLIHIPPVGREWHGLGEIRRKFLPILNKANVDVMFSGHIHRHALYTPGEEGVAFPIVVNSNNERIHRFFRKLDEILDVTADKKSIEIKVKARDGKITNNYSYPAR